MPAIESPPAKKTRSNQPAKPAPFDLNQYGITVEDIQRNLSPAVLYTEAIQGDVKCTIADTGALIAFSGAKTGRSPTDKRVVEHPDSKGEVWWGSVNVPIDDETFETNRERAIDYLNTRKRLYVVDAFAGWDEKNRAKIPSTCTRQSHPLFMHNRPTRPTQKDLQNFGEPDAVIYNAGEFPANRRTKGMTSKTSVDLSLERKEFVILGTEYAGEMKKGVFTMMNYFGPKRGILSMHCSATADKKTGRSSLLFGLSG